MTADNPTIIRNGMVYDGSGSEPFIGDVIIQGQRIAAVTRREDRSEHTDAVGARIVDADGLAVAPGFINPMSWAPITLIQDGRSMSDILQGVTLEVFGEAWSEGPLTDAMRQEVIALQGDIRYDIPWSTLGEYLEHLEKRGVSTNIASFVGADTVRLYGMGLKGLGEDIPTPEETESMVQAVRQAMREGALGLSTALIYPPGMYTRTEDIIKMARASAEYDGIYISHLRSEGNRFLEAIDELLTIARAANIRSEIYHLKAMGQANWGKMEDALRKVENARAAGLQITADMYTYTAAATGLGATMPGWVQAGRHSEWVERLKDPAVRQRLYVELSTPTDEWENMYLMPGSAANILLVGFKSERLKPFAGKTLAELVALRDQWAPPSLTWAPSPVLAPAVQAEIDTILDLVVVDDSNCGTVYFTMTEDNLRKQMQRPWVSIASDSPSQAPEGVFLQSSTHPRAYGTFARFLGKYVRDEGLMPLQEAVRRLTTLPAGTLKIKERAALRPGYYADLAIFDFERIMDNATYAHPQQYASGMVHVFVNGGQVIEYGQHTGVMSGKVVRGPGWGRP
jgi:N-acyl-D-amino-acid deacylase